MVLNYLFLVNYLYFNIFISVFIQILVFFFIILFLIIQYSYFALFLHFLKKNYFKVKFHLLLYALFFDHYHFVIQTYFLNFEINYLYFLKHFHWYLFNSNQKFQCLFRHYCYCSQKVDPIKSYFNHVNETINFINFQF